jgi:hypothetical protein
MTLTKWATLLVVSFFITPLASYCQLSNKDSLLLKEALLNVKDVYFNLIGDQAAKYNGSQYPGYTVSFAEGHPYFRENKMSIGSIVYDNIEFNNVNLLYDEVADKLILQDSTHRIQLLNERLSSFTLQGSQFVKLIKTDYPPLLRTGFYQILSKGPITLYKKETKKIINKISNGNELSVLFEINQNYFIEKNHAYIEIKRKKDLLSLLKEHGKEINVFIKINKLKFKKDKDNTMIQLIEYYNQLTQ